MNLTISRNELDILIKSLNFYIRSCEKFDESFYELKENLEAIKLKDDLETFGYAAILSSPEELSKYNQPLTNYGHLMTIEEFKGFLFIDYDGHGHPVKDNKMSGHYIKPSKLDQIPEDATHIMWYNK